MQPELVIETKGLTKRYDDLTAVDSLDLQIHRGEVFGMLGPNGSGKTTTILMLLGLTEPTAGEVRVLDLDPARQPLSVKSRVGYLPDQIGFYDELTARENLIYTAKLNGLPRRLANERIENALERMGLHDVADHSVATFSRGMRQRLGVADVLIKQPEVIIMDEPTQGLDPEGAHAFLRNIRHLREEGITILISSHLLHQVQAICDRVGLFYLGRMALSGSVAELAKAVIGSSYHIRVQAKGDREVLRKALLQVPGIVEVAKNGNDVYDIVADGDLRAEAAAAVVKAGGRLLSLQVEEPSLDDIYARYFEEVEHDSQH
ncbi:MAG: ABC transporter ATP-binding protein [Chloroflexi bacterium]|nr:ABC transporter ATP-binding protein [Chloroflexota bacterium]